MRKIILLAGVVALPAYAGFSLDGGHVLSTERGEMSRHAPYQDRGMASFRQPDAPMVPKQQRYADSELLVDLAYTPLTETGSGEANVVDGFGDEVPFSDGIALIIPTGWQLYRAKDLPKKDVPETISFNGGKRWPEELRGIGLRNALQFHVDWYQRTIVMSKGRPTVSGNRRIKVIAEPPRPVPPVAPAPFKSSPPTAAIAVAQPASTPIAVVASQGSKIAPVAPSPSVAPTPAPVPAQVPAPAPVPTPTPAPAPKPKPVEVPRVVETRLNVQPGWLSDNLARLSKENGWNPPEWRIKKADFQIKTGYTLVGKDFAEAASKLLMLHPVDAEVNTTTRKITVYEEVR